MIEKTERLRIALEEIATPVKPELCDSELALIVWWARHVDRLQEIARLALTTGKGN